MKKVLITALIASAALICSCSSNQPTTGMVKGNKSKLDTLSYALGANIGGSIKMQMADVPLDFAQIAQGVESAAFDANSMSHEDAVNTLRTYFMETRTAQSEVVAAKRQAAIKEAMDGGATAEEAALAVGALPADADMFESEAQRTEVSYAFGIDLGTNLKSEDLPLQTYWIIQGLNDADLGQTKMTEVETMEYLQNYFTVVRPAQLQQQSIDNLAKIAKESGVITTESGLMYRIEEEGDNTIMATSDADAVKVNYTGRLVRNNKVFDSSRYADTSEEMIEMLKMQNPEGYDQDRPIEFQLSGVIPGWTEGMKLVGKGGRISLWIPAELAYGANGAGRDIGPNEALYFDVELIDVIPAE